MDRSTWGMTGNLPIAPSVSWRVGNCRKRRICYTWISWKQIRGCRSTSRYWAAHRRKSRQMLNALPGRCSRCWTWNQTNNRSFAKPATQARTSSTSMYEFMKRSRCNFRIASLPRKLLISMKPILLDRPLGSEVSIFDEITLPKGKKSSANCFCVVITFKLPIRICIKGSLRYGIYRREPMRGMIWKMKDMGKVTKNIVFT